MTIEQQIITTAQQAVKTLYGQEVPEKMTISTWSRLN